MEIEAKFNIPDRQVYRQLARLRRLAGYTLLPAGSEKVHDRYFDTADGRLLTAGYACRLRSQDGAVIATLKGMGTARYGIHRREEHEVLLPAWEPNPLAWPDGPARALALELTAGAVLQPLFDLTQRRIYADVCDDTRLVARLSLDQVRVHIGSPPQVYYELEIELQADGGEADLGTLAAELTTTWHLSPEPRSKFARAFEAWQAYQQEIAGRLSAEERTLLERYAQGPDASLARRAAAVLSWADGLSSRAISARVGLSSTQVRHWLRAFRKQRMAIFPDAGSAPELQPAAPSTSAVAEQPARKHRLPGVAAFCRIHGVDMAHARFVAAQARALFDALKPVHKMPRKRRRLLKWASLLNTVGHSTSPERPHRAGRDLILAQPLRGVSTTERLALACIVAFNRNKVRPEREPTMDALEEKLRSDVLALTALLRMAEALDFSRTQGSHVQGVVEQDSARAEVLVAGPAAQVDARQATQRADLWYRLFHHELTFVAPEAGAQTPARLPLRSVTEAVPSAEAVALAPAASPIVADEPMWEAGRKVLYLHFGRMLANEPGARLGENAEALHDMRVATRRMRAALRLFSSYFAPEVLQPFNKGLRQTGRTLGAVRDLDVLLEKARAYQASLPAEQAASMEPLLSYWQTSRDMARREMLDYLDSKAYRQFVADFKAFLTTPGAGALEIPVGEPTPHQVRHVVPALILSRYAAVRAYEPLIPGAPLPTMHRLRIDCKGLRYALEFFRDVLGPETPELIKQVVEMQDLLGELQDARVAEELLIAFLKEQRSRAGKKQRQMQLEGVESYLSTLQALQRERLAAFPEPWAALIGDAFRQRLCRAVAVL